MSDDRTQNDTPNPDALVGEFVEEGLEEGVDDLDQEQQKRTGGIKENFMGAWNNSPLFKLTVIMMVIGIAIAAALGIFSGKNDKIESMVTRAPGISEAPGGKASQVFIEQNKMASDTRAEQALKESGSAIPTPVGSASDIDLMNDQNTDPLKEFRAETERLRREQQKQIQAIQQRVEQKPPPPPQVAPEDNSLAQAMQAQMRELMQSWRPQSLRVVNGAAEQINPEGGVPATGVVAGEQAVLPPTGSGVLAGSLPAAKPKPVVSSGTVNYAQLLTEANSDIQAPILAQILSGPLAGARVIGRFQVADEYLVLTFGNASLKGKEYQINALAIDPDTTLAGLASEVDNRYFKRVILPAAATFLSDFGSSFGQPPTETTIGDGGTVVVQQARSSARDALYSAAGKSAEGIGEFFQNEAARTRPLVRLAVGSPMGLFFLTSVEDPDQLEAQQQQSGTLGLPPQFAGLTGGDATTAALLRAATGGRVNPGLLNAAAQGGYYPSGIGGNDMGYGNAGYGGAGGYPSYPNTTGQQQQYPQNSYYNTGGIGIYGGQNQPTYAGRQRFAAGNNVTVFPAQQQNGAPVLLYEGR